jgi:hypothetical protein
MRRADGLLWRTGSTVWTNKILQEGLFPKAFRPREKADRLSPSNTGLKWAAYLMGFQSRASACVLPILPGRLLGPSPRERFEA